MWKCALPATPFSRVSKRWWIRLAESTNSVNAIPAAEQSSYSGLWPGCYLEGTFARVPFLVVGLIKARDKGVDGGYSQVT